MDIVSSQLSRIQAFHRRMLRYLVNRWVSCINLDKAVSPIFVDTSVAEKMVQISVVRADFSFIRFSVPASLLRFYCILCFYL